LRRISAAAAATATAPLALARPLHAVLGVEGGVGCMVHRPLQVGLGHTTVSKPKPTPLQQAGHGVVAVAVVGRGERHEEGVQEEEEKVAEGEPSTCAVIERQTTDQEPRSKHKTLANRKAESLWLHHRVP